MPSPTTENISPEKLELLDQIYNQEQNYFGRDKLFKRNFQNQE